jgi:hypothetical protein
VDAIVLPRARTARRTQDPPERPPVQGLGASRLVGTTTSGGIRTRVERGISAARAIVAGEEADGRVKAMGGESAATKPDVSVAKIDVEADVVEGINAESVLRPPRANSAGSARNPAAIGHSSEATDPIPATGTPIGSDRTSGGVGTREIVIVPSMPCPRTPVHLWQRSNRIPC